MINVQNALSYEETRDLLMCFLFILKHAGEGKCLLYVSGTLWYFVIAKFTSYK